MTAQVTNCGRSPELEAQLTSIVFLVLCDHKALRTHPPSLRFQANLAKDVGENDGCTRPVPEPYVVLLSVGGLWLRSGHVSYCEGEDDVTSGAVMLNRTALIRRDT